MYELGFKNLQVWIKSKQLCLFVYNLSKKFPKEEQYGLTSQIRRAVVSIPSNIAEGYAKSSYKEKLKFVEISYGSLFELITQIEITKDINYISEKEYKEFLKYFNEISKLIYGYKKSLEEKILKPTTYNLQPKEVL